MIEVLSFLMKVDNSSTQERTRKERKEQSRIDFVLSKGNCQWSRIKTTKLLSDYQTICREWTVMLHKKLEERVVVDWKKLERIKEVLKVKESNELEKKQYQKLEKSSLYDKLKVQRNLSTKRIKVYEGYKK